MRVGLTYRFEEKAPPYRAALRAAGLDVVDLKPGAPAVRLDGLVLSGGTDLNPELYGEERHDLADVPDDERDAYELECLREALAADLPVLAICRGMQLLNVALGGTLAQHIDGHRLLDGGTHTVVLTHGGEQIVNSRHHQAVARLGDSLAVTATSPDGVIEGVMLTTKRYVVGVQWHPEDRHEISDTDRQVFTDFAAALRRNGLPDPIRRQVPGSF